jgi:hypothetical protein
MKALEWIKTKTTEGTRTLTDDKGTMIINEKTFSGSLPYRMRQELGNLYKEGTLENGNDYCERVITRTDRMGRYLETMYIFEEFQIVA